MSVNDERLDNLLSLSLKATPKERELSSILEDGYSAETRTWELIVLYHGNLLRYQSEEIAIEILIDGYAIVRLRENLIDAFARLEEVEYIEKPKRLVFAVSRAAQASCIMQLATGRDGLRGKGVLVAILDSGIDIYRREFRNADNRTKILAFLDQTTGREYDRETLNAALREKEASDGPKTIPMSDRTGHGTAVAGIATTIAPDADLVIVRLGQRGDYSYPRTTELMRALKYAVNKALYYNKPMVINISLGSTYGPHDGTSLLDRYIDRISQMGKLLICIGSGNEGNTSGHYYGRLETGENVFSDGFRGMAEKDLSSVAEVEFSVARYEPSLAIQMWKSYLDRIRLTVISPAGNEYVLPHETNRALRAEFEETDVLIWVGTPTPYSRNQEIYWELLPKSDYITEGIWRIRVEGLMIRDGNYDLYLPSQEMRQRGTRFIRPSTERTITVPGTAAAALTVGAYDSGSDSYADFSGRGYVTRLGNWQIGSVKPELVAPGVNIVPPGDGAFSNNGTMIALTGTSFATPIVAGGAALLMEWGITRGNDPYLYGEKCKAYLLAGSVPLRGVEEAPSAMTGWGKLCVAGSIPKKI